MVYNPETLAYTNFLTYSDFPAGTSLASVDVDNKGLVYVLDRVHPVIYKFDRFLNLIATYGEQGSGPFQLNAPRGLCVGHGDIEISYPDNFAPAILGEMFITERWGDSTGVRRYEFGIDILSADAWYRRPAQYPNVPDYLEYEYWLSDWAYVSDSIFCEGHFEGGDDSTLSAPGLHRVYWNIADTSQYGVYEVRVTARSIYNSHQVVKSVETYRGIDYTRPHIISGPVFTDLDSNHVFDSCLIADQPYGAPYVVHIHAVDGDGTVPGCLWHTSCGYFSDLDHDEPVSDSFYTETQKVLYWPAFNNPLRHPSPDTGQGEVEYFKIKAYDDVGIESEEVDSLLPLVESSMECRYLYAGYWCGDANADLHINTADATYIINFVFVPGSPAPIPWESGNVNCDAKVNVADATYLLNYIFIPGSPEPCAGCK